MYLDNCTLKNKDENNEIKKGYSGQLQFYRTEKYNKLKIGLRISNQANKSTGWMPMAPCTEERRGQLRKATGSRKQALIRGYLNGETRLGQCPVTVK